MKRNLIIIEELKRVNVIIKQEMIASVKEQAYDNACRLRNVEVKIIKQIEYLEKDNEQIDE